AVADGAHVVGAACVSSHADIADQGFEREAGIFLQPAHFVLFPVDALVADEQAGSAGQQQEADGHGHHEFDECEARLALHGGHRRSKVNGTEWELPSRSVQIMVTVYWVPSAVMLARL